MYCLIKATLFYKNVLAVFILVISRYFRYCRSRLIIRRVAKMRIGHTAAVWLGTPSLISYSAAKTYRYKLRTNRFISSSISFNLSSVRLAIVFVFLFLAWKIANSYNIFTKIINILWLVASLQYSTIQQIVMYAR